MSETTVSATKLRVLTGIDLDLEVMAINVKWADRLMVDGEKISEENHRGAYPVSAQLEVDDSVKTLLGASLQDILGEAAAAALRESVELRATIAFLNNQIQLLESAMTQP